MGGLRAQRRLAARQPVRARFGHHEDLGVEQVEQQGGGAAHETGPLPQQPERLGAARRGRVHQRVDVRPVDQPGGAR
ncbi:hypothetical protein ACQP2X_31020 [Actinoplanes sp. CA-131856]